MAQLWRSALTALLLVGAVAGGVELGLSAPRTQATVQPLSPRTRVLVVGFDGMTWDVIRPFLAAGRMPNLQRLIATGASAPLRSTFPPSSPPAWTSAVTGVNPGKHGIFGFVRPLAQSRSQRPEFVSSRDRRYLPLWTLLGRSGRKVGVVNVPCTSPVEEVKGFMVGGFPSSGAVSSWPPDLMRRFPGYQVDVFGDTPEPGQEDRWLAKLFAVTRSRGDLVRAQLAEGGYDLFFVVFTETDRVQHFFWKYTDPRHPRYDPAQAERYGSAIRVVHENADKLLGELLEISGPGTTTVVLSDHGFGPLYQGISGDELVRRLNPSLPPGAPPPAYLHDYFGGELYLNGAHLGDAAGAGSDPTREYSDRREQAITTLGDLRTPDLATPLLTEIHRREEVYRGEALPDAPDVLFLEADGYLVTRYHMGGLTGTLPEDFFSGYHRMDGVLVMSGPGIQRSGTIYRASILDVTPTLLHLLGEPVPAYMDGRALTEVLEPGPIAARSPHRVESAGRETRDPHAAPEPEGERSEIEEQLRSLGYLE